MSRGEREQVWRQLIEQQEKSGASVRAFCRQHDIGEHSFYSWRQRLRTESPVTFALVKTEAEIAAAPIIEIFLTSGERLHVPAEVNIIRTVLTALRSQS